MNNELVMLPKLCEMLTIFAEQAKGASDIDLELTLGSEEYMQLVDEMNVIREHAGLKEQMIENLGDNVVSGVISLNILPGSHELELSIRKTYEM